MEGIMWHTEAFHIYPVDIEGPHRAECIHISILKYYSSNRGMEKGCGTRDSQKLF